MLAHKNIFSSAKAIIRATSEIKAKETFLAYLEKEMPGEFKWNIAECIEQEPKGKIGQAALICFV